MYRFSGAEAWKKVFFDKLKPPAGAGGLEKSLFGAFALGLAVAIAVAVAVTIAVSVAIAIAGGGAPDIGGTVEHEANKELYP